MMLAVAHLAEFGSWPFTGIPRYDITEAVDQSDALDLIVNFTECPVHVGFPQPTFGGRELFPEEHGRVLNLRLAGNSLEAVVDFKRKSLETVLKFQYAMAGWNCRQVFGTNTYRPVKLLTLGLSNEPVHPVRPLRFL